MIKRFFSVCVLLLALVLPALGGHVKPGGVYCDGVCSGGACTVCGADCGIRGGSSAPVSDKGEIKDTSSRPPARGSLEDDLFVFGLALFMFYRLRL